MGAQGARNGVLTRQANVQSKGPLITKFARAMVEAIHIYKRDKESTLKIISKYTQITDPDRLDRTIFLVPGTLDVITGRLSAFV